MRRSTYALLVSSLIVLSTAGLRVNGQPQGLVIAVYMTASCHCCSRWVRYLREAGFQVEVSEMDDIRSVRTRHGVPSRLYGCHTAKTNGYVIEGHVPVEQIRRLIAERPSIVGLAVPGMPIGAPGMELGDGKMHSFDVIAFDKAGQTIVSTHGR